MQRLHRVSAGLLMAGTFLLGPRLAVAQEYVVEPRPGIFGEVEIGSSRTLIFTLTSTGITPVSIYGIELTAWDGTLVCGVAIDCDFAITSLAVTWPGVIGYPEELPAFLPTGATLEIEVTFAPESMGEFAGDHYAFLHLITNADSAYSPEFVALLGRAVEASVEPVTLADLIAFFNASVADGSLVGSGPGNSAQGRLKALGNMLLAASDLIERGDCALGRMQLEEVLARADGVEPPPDFVDGPARETLADMIRAVLDALVCS